MENTNIPIVLTVDETAKKCRENGISLTPYYIRRLCKEGKIPAFRIGRRQLVSWDGLLQFLRDLPNTSPHTLNSEASPTPRIRPVDEKLRAEGW